MPVLGIIVLAAIVALAVVIVLDLFRTVPVISAPVLAIGVPVILNAPLIGWYLDRELGAGWLAGAGVGRTVPREYLAAVDRVEWERELPADDRCATRFPILLVYGVGWRDRMLFNAWGRIPRYLKRHGASIQHGEQQAWGTIEENGKQVAARSEQVCELTGAPKVNVIGTVAAASTPAMRSPHSG